MNSPDQIADFPFQTWEGWKLPQFAPNHFFQSRAWFTVLTSTWPDLEIRIRMIGECRALPVFVRRIGPLVLEGSPLRWYTTPYGGFLGTEHRDFKPEYLAGDFNEIALPPRSVCTGTAWKTRKTIVIDLRPGCDAVWNSMRSDTRKKIRKAVKEHVEVRLCRGSEWVEPAYEMCKMTYARQGIATPTGIRFYHEMARTLSPEHAHVYTAVYEGRIVAFAVIGFDEHTSYAIEGGVHPDYRHVCPTNLIQWEVLQWSMAQKLDSYDMCGASMGSIANFKAGFGGETLEFPMHEYTPTILGRVAWNGYIMVRPAMKRVGALLSKRSLYPRSLMGGDEDK